MILPIWKWQLQEDCFQRKLQEISLNSLLRGRAKIFKGFAYDKENNFYIILDLLLLFS